VGHSKEFEALQAKARSPVGIEPPTITFLRYDGVPWNDISRGFETQSQDYLLKGC
jgi:hypothetical protein